MKYAALAFGTLLGVFLVAVGAYNISPAFAQEAQRFYQNVELDGVGSRLMIGSGATGGIQFDGATPDGNVVKFTVTDPTAVRTINLPNQSLGDLVGTTSTSTLTNKIILSAVTASSGATVTLTQAQCGGIFAMDRASGTAYTLPAPLVGCTFDFIYTVAQTSLVNEIETDALTTFIQGAPLVSGTTTAAFACTATTAVSIKSNDTTTGGLLGGHLRFVALTTTLWQVDGLLVGSGTVGTPCSASD